MLVLMLEHRGFGMVQIPCQTCLMDLTSSAGSGQADKEAFEAIIRGDIIHPERAQKYEEVAARLKGKVESRSAPTGPFGRASPVALGPNKEQGAEGQMLPPRELATTHLALLRSASIRPGLRAAP